MLTVGLWSAGSLKKKKFSCLNEEVGREEKEGGILMEKTNTSKT